MYDLRYASPPWYRRLLGAVLTMLGGAVVAVGVYALLSRLGF